MTHEDFYGAYYEIMKQTEKELLELIVLYSSTKREKEGIKSIVYYCLRIKTPESMLNKLAARGFEQTVDAAIPKPNGYRSYHILLQMKEGKISGCHAEIQVRTIANDFWATLEHQIKYKKDLRNEKLIRSELKRCADEIASVDMSMQTIRDVIRENSG